jgi:hypothetical protein
MVGWEDMAATLREIEHSARDEDAEAMVELAEILAELLDIARHQVAALDPETRAAS